MSTTTFNPLSTTTFNPLSAADLFSEGLAKRATFTLIKTNRRTVLLLLVSASGRARSHIGTKIRIGYAAFAELKASGAIKA